MGLLHYCKKYNPLLFELVPLRQGDNIWLFDFREYLIVVLWE